MMSGDAIRIRAGPSLPKPSVENDRVVSEV